jgi:lipopolysaccharide transport system ATP-binding protein
MHPAITFDHISKRYRLGSGQTSLREALASSLRGALGRRSTAEDRPFLWALRDVSFEVPRGGALGLIGPNGAGKTTALKILASITQPTSGRLSVRGRVSALIELGAGFHPDLTGRENVYLNGAILGLSSRDIDRSFDRIVEFAGLERFIDTPVKRYSSGMYVRLGFSVAAHVEPDVLLVDEVLAVGDAHFRQKCAERIEALRKMGTTLIFVAHNLYLVRSVCDEVLFMADGQIKSQGDPVTAIGAYERWLQGRQLSARSLVDEEDGSGSENGPAAIDIRGVEILTAEGQRAEEFTPADAVEIRVHYTARRPIHSPNFVLRIIRADGTTCSMIRTADHGIALEDLDGSGSLSLIIDPLQLTGGAYAIGAMILGPIDGVALGHQHSDWFRVHSTMLSFQEASGVFIPHVAAARLIPGSQIAPQASSTHDPQSRPHG